MSGPRALGYSLLRVSLASLVALAACTGPHKLVSARHTACPVRKLEIRNLVTQPQREDWIAVCGHEQYACSTRERGRRLVYACQPLADAGAPAAPTVQAPNASDAGVEGASDGSVGP